MGTEILPLIDVLLPGKRHEFWSMGDCNMDGVIDDKDVALLQAAWGSNPSSPNWNVNCDLNGDGVVDSSDTAILARNFGKNIWTYIGWGSQEEVEALLAAISILGVVGVGLVAGSKYAGWW